MLQHPQEAANLREPKAEIVRVGDGIVFAQVGNVSVAIWRKKPTPDRFEIQRSCLDAAVKRNAGRAVFMCVVEAGTEPPDEDVRKASSAMVTSHGPNLKAVSIVVEGTGFKAAISRTVLSGIVFLIRTPSPIKYFESPASGAAWLAQFVQIGSAANFVEQVEVVRAVLAKS
jgi:hypothetical protein